MSLLKTTPELKEHFSSIDKDYEFSSIVSFRNDVEDDFIKPEIGAAMFGLIQTAYNNSLLTVAPVPLTGKMKELHRLLQKAITHLSLYLSADSGSFRISDSGFYVFVSGDHKPVSDKKMSVFRSGRKEAGFRALEQAIEYLELNIDDALFFTYALSDQHLSSRAFFINSAKVFTTYFKAINNSTITFRAMLDSLDRAERTYILPVLGETFFDVLKAKILDGNLTINEKKLIKIINRPLALFTVGEAVPVLPMEFDGTNIFINNSPAYGNSENVEGKIAASEGRLSILMNNCMMQGEAELQRLKAYLIKNAGLFPSYTIPKATGEVDDANNIDRGIILF